MDYVLILIVTLSGLLAGLLRFLKELTHGSVGGDDSRQCIRYILGGILGAYVAISLVVQFSELDLHGLTSDSGLEVALTTLLAVSISTIGGYIGTPMLDKLGSIALNRLDAIDDKAKQAQKSADQAHQENEAQNLIEAAKTLATDLRNRDESFSDIWQEVVDISSASIKRADTHRAYIIRASALSKLGEYKRALQDLAFAENLVSIQASKIDEIENPYAYTYALINWNRACYLSLSKKQPVKIIEFLARSIRFCRSFREDLASEEDLAWVRESEASKKSFQDLTKL